VTIVVRRSVKLDLPQVAAFVAARDGARSDQLLNQLQRTFGCQRRAAQDALTILVRGGWLERRDDEHDARRKRYLLTQHGHDDLRTAHGQREMRLARWQHSTTSTRARKQRARQPDNLIIKAILEATLEGRNLWPGLIPR
jgi:DNA-binding MarR family transcriptional regulator